ncbi:MAG: hypothetical protein GXO56_07200 [Chloroflexi bacterium]|nr:hypothetical protein [Chloroflexota bacterium]
MPKPLQKFLGGRAVPAEKFSPAELRIDLKSAARLGDPEALDWALEGFRAWPAFAANAPLDEADVQTILVPLGEILAMPTVPQDYLQEMAASSWAGIRALAAVALAARALQGNAAPGAWLRRLAADPRDEVRTALETFLRKKAAEAPDALLAMLTSWKQAKQPLSPRAAVLMLHVLPDVPEAYASRGLRLAAAFRDDSRPEVQRALGDALRRFATQGLDEEVLALLTSWIEAPPTPAEAYARALRGSWPRRHRDRALALLTAIENRFGTSRPLRRARQALEATEE